MYVYVSPRWTSGLTQKITRRVLCTDDLLLGAHSLSSTRFLAANIYMYRRMRLTTGVYDIYNLVSTAYTMYAASLFHYHTYELPCTCMCVWGKIHVDVYTMSCIFTCIYICVHDCRSECTCMHTNMAQGKSCGQLFGSDTPAVGVQRTEPFCHCLL